MLRQDDAIKALLVFEGWRQGLEYGGHIASCMIMSCLSNRVRSGWGSWIETIYRIPAFSALHEQPNRDIIPTIWEPGFVRLLHEVEGIYDSSISYAKDSLYWCDTRNIQTDFFKDKILGNLEAHPRCCDLGTLTFFR